MPNISVTCRCTRRMRQEVSRPAGFLFCSCGTKVRIDDRQHTACHGRDRDGEPCERKLMMTTPIALCRAHVLELARTDTFLWHGVTDQQRIAWEHRKEAETADQRRKRRMREARWDVEERLRQEQLKAQSVVYYIARGDLIKIGFTTNMRERMNSLMPDAVLATEPGDRRLESKRHRQFGHCRATLGREYFIRHPDLLLHVETVLAEQGEPTITGYPKYDTWHVGGRMLVSVKEAARLSGVPVRTLYEWIREKRLTVVTPAKGKRGVLLNAFEVDELTSLRKAGRLPRVDRAS